LSATNRGGKRVKSDFYPTPISAINNFLDNYKLKEGVILEPCVGNGNFIKAIRDYGYDNYIVANEIESDKINNLEELSVDEIHNSDFLNNKITTYPRTIITNPPFSIAQEFLEKCFEQFPKAEVIMLLRTNFLESKKRYDFWQKYPVNRLYVLSQRPSFTGKGTDATSYSFFIWDHSNKQEIKVI
jgi:hypothetical protein